MAKRQGRGTPSRRNQGLEPPEQGMLQKAAASEQLRGSGARMTAQRLAVLDALEANRTHPAAETIIDLVHQRLGHVSPATIYNTLESLESLGLVRRLNGLEPRARFDPDTTDHQHAICKCCGRVWDIQVPDPEIPGFCVEDVVVRGICEQCQAKQNESQSSKKECQR